VTRRSKHSASAGVSVWTSRCATRQARTSTGCRCTTSASCQCTHSLQVGDISAILHGERESVADFPRPAFQGHALGLAGDVGQRGAGRRAEAAEVGGGSRDHGYGDEKADVIFFNGDVQGLHGATIQGPRTIARDR